MPAKIATPSGWIGISEIASPAQTDGEIYQRWIGFSRDAP